MYRLITFPPPTLYAANWNFECSQILEPYPELLNLSLGDPSLLGSLVHYTLPADDTEDASISVGSFDLFLCLTSGLFVLCLMDHQKDREWHFVVALAAITEVLQGLSCITIVHIQYNFGLLVYVWASTLEVSPMSTELQAYTFPWFRFGSIPYNWWEINYCVNETGIHQKAFSGQKSNNKHIF